MAYAEFLGSDEAPATQRLPTLADSQLWRRWCDGPAHTHEGRHVVSSALAVVVIGYRAQEDLAAAVASLREQSVAAEVVVVNSGGGAPERKLQPHLEHIRLIDVEAPLFVGAARNIGIDSTQALYVAFLAGDCTAGPGWVEARLRSHHAGARAVASAVSPPADANYWTRAAHIFLFGTRAPQAPIAMAKRYGASYDRRLFDEVGYFNPALRTGEDSDMARRLRTPVMWNREIITIHVGPRTLMAFMGDLYARGRRAARHQLGRRSGKPATDFRDLIRHRLDLTLTVAREAMTLEVAEIERYRPVLTLGAIAYAAGIWRGFAGLDRAKTLLRRSNDAAARGKNAAAIRHAERAIAADGQNVEALLCLIELSRRNASQQSALNRMLDKLGWLCAFDERRQLGLCDWLLERDMVEEAFTFAARARLAAPRSEVVDERLAEAARARGDQLDSKRPPLPFAP